MDSAVCVARDGQELSAIKVSINATKVSSLMHMAFKKSPSECKQLKLSLL